METKETRSAGGVVVNDLGQVLIAAHQNDVWGLPKGHVDDGEDPLAAAKREIAEETGVTVLEYIKDLGSFTRFRIGLNGEDDKSELKTITFYHFKSNQVDLKPTDPHNPDARWVNKNEIVNLLTHPKDKEFFNSIINQI